MSLTDLLWALLGNPGTLCVQVAWRAKRLSFPVLDGLALMFWKQSPLPSSYLALALQELRGRSPDFTARMTLLPSGQHVGMPDRKVGDRTTQYMLLSLVLWAAAMDRLLSATHIHSSSG